MPASVPNKEKWGKLVDHFAFYAAYHDNPINQLIHVVCVPFILMTGLMFGTFVDLTPYAPALLNKFVLNNFGVPLTLTVVATFMYCAYYIYLSPGWLGFSAAFLVLLDCLCAYAWASWDSPNAVNYAIAVHIIGWVAQFYGHGVHEGRAPALLDNLFQALAVSFLFVYIETLMSCGLLKSLKKAVDPEKQRRIDAFRGVTQMDKLKRAQ
jgi:uncharacterized membrane protein YGL010W